MSSTVNFYNTGYGDFAGEVRAKVRRETYGKDIGQNSWLTVEELERFARLAGFSQATKLLEAACGSGGPAIYLTETLGLNVTGIDINDAAIESARRTASARNVANRAKFLRIDARAKLSFEDQSFSAVLCIDSINHMPDRNAVLKEWRRVLRPGGMLLYTDPIIVTGAISHEEITIRSSIGFFLFVPLGENERALREAGFTLVQQEDVTENEAMTSARWIAAREAHRAELTEIEGIETYEGTQRFLHAVHALSSSRRLSRHMFLARHA